MRTKADLATSLRDEAGVQRTNSIPYHDPSDSHHAIDGMNLVHKTGTQNCTTFGDYSENYRKKVYSYPSNLITVDFDRYDRKTTKDETHKSRKKKKKESGKKFKKKAVEKVVAKEIELPSDFPSFLTISKNKQELQKLLAEDLIKYAPDHKTIIVNGCLEDPSDVRCSDRTVNLTDLDSDHQEADSRMILSLIFSNASRSVIVTEDTDVLIELLSHDLGRKQIYMHQRISVKRQPPIDQFTNICDLRNKLQEQGINTAGLPLLHSLTGCDQNSFLYGIDKGTALAVYKKYQVG